MLVEYDQCWCTVNISEDKMTGKTTQMNHIGKGIFCCPKCGEKVDISDNTYKIRVRFYKKNDNVDMKIIKPFDDRLMTSVQDKYPDRLNKDVLEEDLYEGFPYDKNDYVLNHKIGVFDILIFWEWDSYYTDCGTEWDLEMFIIEEKEVT